MKKIFFLCSVLLSLSSCFSCYHTGREIVGIEDARRDYTATEICPQCWINLSDQETWDIVAFPISIPMIPPSFVAGMIVGSISQIFEKDEFTHDWPTDDTPTNEATDDTIPTHDWPTDDTPTNETTNDTPTNRGKR